ncbi:TMEMX1 [Hibiscus syriacus]|uniref:TMEMX1 n=1 Tax=Hibiscus syriacus TaxID=106335 RepID=A0A6A2XZY6_HIBSY|nr:TMEMX1 [Hibiscus syriacus]
MVSGTKRPSPECPVSPSYCQSPSTSSINGHLFYVRRKPEAELGKNCTFDCISTSNCQQPRHAGQVEGIRQQNPEIKEPKVSCLPAFSPVPMTSSTSSSAKASVPLHSGKPAMRLPSLESNQHPVVSAASGLDSPRGTKKLHWEERYYQLQMLLKKLDQSDLEDYARMLRSLSAVELSKHAVELEKRSIQLSLEEGEKLWTVSTLNCILYKCNTSTTLYTFFLLLRFFIVSSVFIPKMTENVGSDDPGFRFPSSPTLPNTLDLPSSSSNAVKYDPDGLN